MGSLGASVPHEPETCFEWNVINFKTLWMPNEDRLKIYRGPLGQVTRVEIYEPGPVDPEVYRLGPYSLPFLQRKVDEFINDREIASKGQVMCNTDGRWYNIEDFTRLEPFRVAGNTYVFSMGIFP